MHIHNERVDAKMFASAQLSSAVAAVNQDSCHRRGRRDRGRYRGN